MSRVLVVRCHPLERCFIDAAHQRLLTGLADAEVESVDLYGEAFRPAAAAGDDDPVMARHRDLLRWCDTLVLVYPTWWAGQPAMLKGWIDRVWEHALAGRERFANIGRIVVITSHGSTKLINMAEGEGGKRTVTRNLAPACSVRTRTRWVALYGIDRADERRRIRFLDRVEAVGRRIA